MNWWPITENLRDYLRERSLMEGSGLAGVDIHAGAANPIENYPCLEVLWDEESGGDPHKNTKGKIILWLDGWVENDDPDPGVIYGLLYQLQRGFFDVLGDWPKFLGEKLEMAIKVIVGRTVSDGDTNRPIGGSRTILEIEWRKNQYE